MNQRNANDMRTEVLHWDGRLDNREDLLPRFRDSLRGDSSNRAIAAAVYERWGTDGLVQLIGDWSLVIDDRVNRLTVLASDFAGVRPLYYHVQAGRVWWSNRLQSVVDATRISELDEQYLAGFLTVGGYSNHTPYKGIYSVPPGHAVSVSSDRTSTRKFWELPIGDVIRYRSERRYEEHLRALFQEAVKARLQNESPVLAELSGGLDSSSVVCMAKHLVSSGAVAATRLAGVSFTWPNSLDEPFIREVESHCGISGVQISAHDVPIVTSEQTGDAMPEPFQPLRTALAQTAQQCGAQTILTGQNGDLIMGNWFDDSLQVASSLRGFRLGRACGEALAWSRILRLPVYRILWRAFQAALPPTLTPEAIYAAPDGSYVPRSAETSLLPGFTTRTKSASCFSNVWKQASPERRKYFYNLTMALELRTLQIPEPLRQFDYTHPFGHRPLVEFLSSVPPEILCRPGAPRRLMRLALADLWPGRLRDRRSKCSFSGPWQEALRPLAHLLLNDRHFHLVDHGIVDRASVRSRLERLCVGLDCNEYQLRQIIMLELWLRNRVADGLAGHLRRAA
ncbi:MAG TPA: asparagine synthase-related protein [Pyrinomonadaceae bacterium]|nr:asparagine synthase-related protein [Pyrinomonadaceae bacterium]